MPDFDPQDVVTTTTVPAVKKSDFAPEDITPTEQGSDFSPEDVIPPKQGNDFAESDVLQVEHPDGTLKPSGTGGYLTDDDIRQVAAKHGVDPDELRNIAPYFAVADSKSMGLGENLAKQQAGQVGRVLLNIPQFIYKKMQDEPMRKAIDELQGIGEQQRGPVQALAEGAALPIGGAEKAGVGAVKSMAKAAGLGGAVGGTYGLTTSKEGQEVSGTVKGVAVGSTLGLGISGLSQLASHLSGSEKAAVRAMPEEARNDLDAGTKAILKEREASEDIIRQKVFEPELKPLTDAEVKTVITEQIPEEARADLFDPATESGQIHLEQHGGDVTAAERAKAEEIVETRAKDLAEHITKERPESLEEARQALSETTQGPAKVQESFDVLATRKAAEDYIESTGHRAGSAETFGARAANFLSDQLPMRVIDEKVQGPISAERTLNELNQNTNRMRWIQEAMEADLGKIVKENPDTLPALRDGTITNAIDSGKIKELPENLQRAATAVREYLDKWRDFVNGKVTEKDPNIAPLKIKYREDYVPHLIAAPEKVVVAVQQKTQEALQQATAALGRDVESLSDITAAELKTLTKVEGPIQDLERSVKLFDTKQSKSGQDLMNRLRDTFESRESSSKLATMARAAEERTDAIPEYLREKNTFILLNRWGTNTLRHLYLRSPMEKLGVLADIAEKAGGKLESNYLRRHLADLNGIRPGTAAAWTRGLSYNWQRQMGRIITSDAPAMVKASAEVGRVLPEILRDMTMQIYPNLIGLNPKSHLQHLLQPFYKMWPELGGSYGLGVTLRGIAKTVLHMPTAIEKAAAHGYTPADFVPQFRYLTAEGLRADPVYAKAMQLANKFGNGTMFLYTKIYELNKAVAQSVGEMMAHDIAIGAAGAEKALGRLPTQIQRAVRAEPDRAAQILGHYLGDAVVYNYNRASMSEFGRTMGPLFSTFSKWPLATAGDIMAEYRTKNVGRASLAVSRKYLAPWAAMVGVQQLLFGSPDQMSDAQKKLVGASGLGGMAPVMAIGELRHREFGTPPVVDTLLKAFVSPAIKGLQERDAGVATEGLKKGFANTVQQFTPGSVWVRFFTDDLPTYIYGHRPAGEDFLERTQSGFHRMTK